MSPSTSRSTRRAGIFSTAISLVSAVLSSACCWGPLLALGLGTSAAGFSTTFAPLRPYFLGLAGLSLAASFYLLFVKPRRGQSCESDAACFTPHPRLRRFQVGAFWVSVLMVAAFAFFPNYIGVFQNSGGTPLTAATPELPIVTYHVEGMTCRACATSLTETLEQLPGVLAAEVDYDAKRARIQTRAPLDAALDQAIEAVFEENDFHGSRRD